MTFTTIQTEILARLNLTSSEASTRVGRLINIHYRDLTASLGLDVSRRTKVSANTAAGSSELTFASIEHIEQVVDERAEPYKILTQVLYVELRGMNPEGKDSDTPNYWAVKSVTSSGIVVALDVTAESIFALKADGLGTNSDLSGSTEPAFPQSFHYILIERVLYDEYMKMEKEKLAQLSLSRAEKGLSDLRMFIAKSAFLDIQQGKLSNRSWIFNQNDH